LLGIRSEKAINDFSDRRRLILAVLAGAFRAEADGLAGGGFIKCSQEADKRAEDICGFNTGYFREGANEAHGRGIDFADDGGEVRAVGCGESPEFGFHRCGKLIVVECAHGVNP
jgi:hypothetical protein